MKAAVYYETGGPEVLKYEEIPDPQCHPKGVIIKVEAIAIEGGDVLSRFGGKLMTNPHVVGYQASGEIIEIGSEVTHLKVGQKVATLNSWGSHAALRAVPARNCWVVPDGYDMKKAAAIPVTFGTAHDCLFEFGRMQPGAADVEREAEVGGRGPGAAADAQHVTVQQAVKLLGQARNQGRVVASACTHMVEEGWVVQPMCGVEVCGRLTAERG